MTSVRLSTVIANYNHGSFLEERLRSILCQLGATDEIVIVDDASTDDSWEIIERIAKEDNRIRFFKNETNRGPIWTYNVAFQKARGIYAASFSSDDQILAGFVEQNMQIMESNPGLALCCSDNVKSYSSEPGKLQVDRLMESVEAPIIFDRKKVAGAFRKTPFWIPTHTIVFRRDLFLKHGGYLESLGPHCDWFAFHVLGLRYGIAYIPKSLSVWWQDEKSYFNACQKHVLLRFELNLFAELTRKERKEEKKLFLKSGLMNAYVKQYFLRLLIRPKYFEFVLVYLCQVAANRWRRMVKANV